MPEPLVSIIMAVHNAESTVNAALDSIYAQTYKNWELIICDDASTDLTSEVLKRSIDSNEGVRVRLLSNPENRMLAYSLNRCLAVASGVLVARMDADDLSEPDRLKRQVQFLMSNPEVDLVGTTMRRFNEHSRGGIVEPASLEPDRWTLGRTTRVPFCHATILARRDVFDRIGNYTVSWRTERGQDLDLWYKFFAAGLMGRNLSDPLYRVREDEASVRRRTPRARFGAFMTRMQGNWMLRYSPRAYGVALLDLAKVVVPYGVVDWSRQRARAKVRPEG